ERTTYELLQEKERDAIPESGIKSNPLQCNPEGAEKGTGTWSSDRWKASKVPTKGIYYARTLLPMMRWEGELSLWLEVVNCIPGRWKDIHVINESILMKAAWNIIKHFLTQKIKDRVIIHSEPSDIFDYFPRSIIPTQYGGTLLDHDMEDWIRRANREQEKNSIQGQPNFYSC
ncbi:hypothetical protein AVEN_139550-1, partial [Araneus ventricosus]